MSDLLTMFEEMEGQAEYSQNETWKKSYDYLTIPYSDDNIVYITDKQVGDLTQNINVVDESYSQYIQFEMPRFYDGVDLLTKRLYVHWESDSGAMGDNNAAVNVLYSESNIRFGWVCPPEAVATESMLKIMPFATGEHDGKNYVFKTMYAEYKPKVSLKTYGGITQPASEWFLEFERKMTTCVDEAKASEQSAENSKNFLKDSIFAMTIQETKEGELITTEDSANIVPYELSIFGKSKQFTTTGAQLFDASALAITGADSLDISENGYVITVTGSTAYSRAQINMGTQWNGKSLRMVLDEYEASTNSITAVQMVIENSDGTSKYIPLVKAGSASIDIPSDAKRVVVGIYPNNASSVLETAATLTVKGLRIYESANADLPWEPYTGGKASPNPEYPQEIESVASDDGVLVVKVVGAQLMEGLVDGYTHISGGLTIVTNSDGCVVNGTPTNAYVHVYSKVINLDLGTYYISGGRKSGEDPIFAQVKITLADGSIKYYAESSFVVDGTETEIRLSIQNATNVDALTNYALKPMLNAGDTALPWEPYKETSAPLTLANGLPGIPVESGGNYTDGNGQQYIADEIRLNANGTGVWVHNVEGVVFDGSSDEGWKAEATNTDEIKRARTDMLADSIKREIHYSNAINGLLCDCFEKCSSAATFQLTEGISSSMPGGLYVYSELFNTADVTLWTAHLAENPMTVIYELAEPYETTLTAEEINQFLAMRMQKPYSTVFNDEGAYQKLTYICDPKIYINNAIAKAVQTIVETV